MEQQTQRDLGRLEGRVDAMEEELKELKEDTKAILQILNQAQGGWKMLVVVGGIAGTIGGIIGNLLPFFGGAPR